MAEVGDLSVIPILQDSCALKRGLRELGRSLRCPDGAMVGLSAHHRPSCRLLILFCLLHPGASGE